MAEPEDAGDVKFTRIEKGDLAPMAAVAQCLDNQWVSASTMQAMLDGSCGFDGVDVRRSAEVRTEYMRALLNAQQVVINRSFLINNSAVYCDFEQPGRSRKAFQELLNDGTIVPFLLGEKSPTDNLGGSAMSKGLGVTPWYAVARETQMSCLRLSWTDDVSNKQQLTAGLARRFHEFVANLRTRCLDDGDKIFASHLGVRDQDVPRFGKRLSDATAWANTRDELITREEFYKEFVMLEGKEPATGYFDTRKPFVAELKQLIDLAYNTTLPEVLDRYPLRPPNSLHRAALQEWKQTAGRSSKPTDPQTLVERTLKSRLAFDEALEPLTIVSLDDIQISDIVKVRRTSEWATYIDALRATVEEPEFFETHAIQLREAYATMLRVLEKLQPSGLRRRLFRPSMALNFEFAGVTIRVRQGFYDMVGQLLPGRFVGTARCLILDGGSAKTTSSHALAADLQTFEVDSSAEVLGFLESSLQQSGLRRVGAPQPQNRGVRDGGFENDQEDAQ